ncbi:MAG TPA: Lrp/AsnC family transcriptional regulator, partial [Rhodoferax sp.]|nr:Lrp/AsnC family transcriptional regulator [Rhodoferax sp.]
MEQISIDETDFRLLDQLQRDASLNNQALAQRVHVSPPTCLRRVRRLTEAGLIERQI